ncbi:MAG: DUF4382 domain-containing protein [Peptococcaceae bacterium]|nr:DUF4382 domain-containing protein [Peptococcaceae bacterium]
MKKLFPIAVMVVFLVAVVLSGCGSGTEQDTETGTSNEAASQTSGETQVGTLEFRANGEDFVRQGFVSKDGWAITFDHVYVTLADVTAYQCETPYDAHKGGKPQAAVEVVRPGTHTVDLAEGGEDAPPILVGKVEDVPVGHYNAISWKMVKAASGPAKGYSLVIMGKAEKDGKTINFAIKNEKEYSYTGGEYVGDERKGIVQEGGTADLEMTFHFDHIFGDAETPADDELNVGAPGFEPFAAIAENGTVDADMAALKEKLSSKDYQKLVDILPTLGHVGEGHCHCEVL